MTVVQRIIKNASVLFFAQIITAIASIIFSVYLARKLGDIEFGKYSFALAFATYFSVFLDLGYNTLLIRDVARDKSLASKYLGNLLIFRAISSIIVFISMVVSIMLLGYPTETRIVVYLLGIFTIVLTISDIYKVTFRAFERMEYEAAINVFSLLFRVIIGLILLFSGYGLIEISIVCIISSILDLAFCFYFCQKKFVKTPLHFSPSFIKTTFKAALPIGMLSLFATIYVRTDTILLSIMKGDAVVGWYNAAYNLVIGFKLIPHLFMNVLLPLMSYYFVSSKDLLKITYEKSFRYLLILGLPLSAGLCLLSDKIIIFFYGTAFSNSIIALQILAWDSFLVFLYSCLAFVLVSINKQNQMAIIAGVTALINVVLNLFLIPTYSYVGSAVATIIAEGFIFVAYLCLISVHLHKLPLFKIFTKPILGCAGMVFIVWQLHNMNLFILIGLGIIVYFGLFALMKGFSKDDISLIKQLLQRQKKQE